MDCKRRSKRQKVVTSGSSAIGYEDLSLTELVGERHWGEAIARVNDHPEQAAVGGDPSPLALACRLGAPVECVKVLLDACPERLRHLVDARGTPLHEAMVCENVGVDVIKCLLKTDEALGTSSSTRATLLQDVDGFTPLHLLIRRRFQSDILRDDGLLHILEILVKSCSEAVVIPDRGEYEEPPIVYALKANLYAPLLGTEDDMTARIERRIYEMVDCMLQHYPRAASCVFNGYRGPYTALHSAVFHGRIPDTIELLLKAEKSCPSSTKTCLLANTQGEMPLHFCAMRGERPRSLVLLGKAAPEAVLKREASGLTPMHWLWIRYINSLLASEGVGRRGDGGLKLEMDSRISPESNSYNEFTSLERGDFDSDFRLIHRLDPPVDYLRMRHIPVEVLGEEDCIRWAERTVDLLKHIRERHARHFGAARSSFREEDSQRTVFSWTRQEVVASLFWTKVTALLEAANVADDVQPVGGSVLVHSAFSSSCCIPAVARIVASLFPEEMHETDERGRLPLHYAACRAWHFWDWPLEEPEGSNDSPSSQFLRLESLSLVRTAIELSPPRAARAEDKHGRLPIHYMIETFVRTCCRSWPLGDDIVQAMLDVLREIMQMYPESLQKRDGLSDLYPFMHAAAVATECRKSSSDTTHVVSITYMLLRENPTTLLRSGIVAS